MAFDNIDLQLRYTSTVKKIVTRDGQRMYYLPMVVAQQSVKSQGI